MAMLDALDKHPRYRLGMKDRWYFIVCLVKSDRCLPIHQMMVRANETGIWGVYGTRLNKISLFKI